MGWTLPDLSRRSFLSGSLAVMSSTLLLPARAGAARPAADLDFASALAAARAIRAGEISSLELTRHTLDRISRLNPRINAIVTLTADAALARAREADDALARKVSWGPVHGVPCTIKDTFETAGVRTTAGATQFTNHVPARDAVVVARLRGAGAVILGKTNVPRLAADWQSYNEIFGATNNPWDVTRTPGGSSGGEAAALAAGLTFLSVGSDIGGSIRVPAHFCGVYGHKPTLNVVPNRGHIPPPPNVVVGPQDLAVAGPLARSAADLKAMLEVLGGPDNEDATAYRWSLPPARGARLSDYRIGYVVDDPLCRVSPDATTLMTRAVDALRKGGAQLEEGWPDGVNPAIQYDTYLYLLWATFSGLMPDDQFENLRKLAAQQDGSMASKRALAWTAPQKVSRPWTGRRMAARARWQEYFRTHDAFLMPTSFIPAFAHDHSPSSDRRTLATAAGPRPYFDLLFWISFATVTGLPATTAPIGLTRDGLPVGMQIMGPYLEDATPIDVAGKLADLIGGFQRPNGY
jgi:amidase